MHRVRNEMHTGKQSETASHFSPPHHFLVGRRERRVGIFCPAPVLLFRESERTLIKAPFHPLINVEPGPRGRTAYEYSHEMCFPLPPAAFCRKKCAVGSRILWLMGFPPVKERSGFTVCVRSLVVALQCLQCSVCMYRLYKTT